MRNMKSKNIEYKGGLKWTNWAFVCTKCMFWQEFLNMLSNFLTV